MANPRQSVVRRRFACALDDHGYRGRMGLQASMPTLGYIVGWSLAAAAFVIASTW